MPILFTRDCDWDEEVRSRVVTLLETLRWEPLSKKFKKIEVMIYPPSTKTLRVSQLHAVWNPEVLPELQSPPNTPRLSEVAECPPGSRLVEVSYISRISGGMGSYHQFDGYFLSIILSQDARSFLDVRGEVAY